MNVLTGLFLLLIIGGFISRRINPKLTKFPLKNPSKWHVLVFCFVLFILFRVVVPKTPTDKNIANSTSDNNIKQQTNQDQGIKLLNPKQLEYLIAFQKHWADSVARNTGKFIIKTELSLPDSILFELGEEATKHFNSNRRDVLPFYINWYKESLSAKGYNYDLLNTVIDFIPNKKLLLQSYNNDWTHPIIKNRGLKIYSGNQYAKEYIGTLSCKYKYDGSTYYRILTNDGRYTEIEDYNFSNCWVKSADSKAKYGIGLPTCY